MKNKYLLCVQMHNFSDTIEVWADDVQIKEGSYKFVKDMGSHWKPIAFYPVQYTIIHKIEEIKTKQ
jgi:hypothetical protein